MKYDKHTIKEWAGNSQWRRWRADLARFKAQGHHGWGSECFWVLSVYRIQRFARRAHPRWAWLPLRVVLGIVKKAMTVITHINLDPAADIGAGLFIAHVGPIQVIAGASIGADCALHQVCTIGAGNKPGMPRIGDHVYLGCHVCVLGPVQIGDRAKIGAGAVVVSDIPADATAVGVPAKPLERPVPDQGLRMAPPQQRTLSA